MRVAVIGAGAVGGTIAALLQQSGHEVEVTARGAHLEAIRAGGIALSGAFGAHTARVTASEGLLSAPEIAFVTTKAQDAEGAVRAAGRLLDGVPVVVVQNGMGGVAVAQAANPSAVVVGALALFAASYLSPGQVAVTAPGPVYLGAGAAPDDEGPATGGLTRAAKEAVEVAARVLGAVVPVAVTPDFPAAQWTKLVVNQVNALPAITGLSAQAVIADRALRRIMVRGMRETVRAGLASGVRFASLQGLSHALLRAFAAAPYPLAQLLPRAMARRMGETPNPGSTLQSIRRGQLTEVDHLNGAVVAAADAVGMAAPVNAALVRLVHSVEMSGRFLTPSEVARSVSAR